MNYNIIEEYISFNREKYLEFFKIILGNHYSKYLCSLYIDKYIDVRYYNETNYLTEKDFINRLNKELVDLTKKIAEDDNIEDIKNIVALFGYIVYFDDVCVVSQEMELINTLVTDDTIKISNKEELKQPIKEWYIRLKKGKEKFNNTIRTKDFSLLEVRLYKKLHYLELEHNVKISNLYSEYAIDKAYNSGTVNEDKLFITYILASSLVLNNAINLDFSRYYLVPLAGTLFEKEKKFTRLINVINNSLAKKFISLRITYSDYKKNKFKINDLISEGYSFGIELDSKYTGITSELVLFPYIFVYEDTPEYEMLMREKDLLKSKIIKL